jgi:hypothetical protein
MRLAPLLTLLLLGAALAQPVAAPEAPTAAAEAPTFTLDERGWPVGDDPAAVADAAVLAWLDRPPVVLTDIAALPPAEACQRLPDLLGAPPPPSGTRVVLEDRRPLEVAAPDDGRQAFTYAAVRPPDLLDVVQVDLVRVDGLWRIERVGFRVTHELSGIRAWLQTPVASIGFVLFTLLVALGLARPSPLRRGLATGMASARAHRRTIAVTMGLLYTLFGLGVFGGASLPPSCDTAVLAVLEGAIAEVGALQAYGSGDVARAAVVTFYQNFVVVTFSLHFFLVLLLGIPSYLVAIPQFFVLGVPFGLLAGTSALALVPVVVLVLVELTAYFLVVSGGGIVLGTLFRRGFGAYPQAVRTAASLLVPAGLLLLFGAWYEAILLVWIGI